MRRVLTLLLLTLTLSAASALTLPQNARVTLVSDGGVVLGVGEIADGSLSLTLEVGAEGFVTLLIEGEGGAVVSLDGVVSEGEVLVVGEGRLEGLAQSVVAAGGEVEVTFAERVAQGVESLTDLPQQAQEGILGAIGNHAAALDRAAAGRANAGGEAESDSEADVEGDVEGDAEGDVEADVEADAEVDAEVEAEIGGEAEGSLGTGAANSAAGAAEAEAGAGLDLSVGVGTSLGGGRP